MKNRMLIIEDDVVIQTQLRNLLIGNGYEADSPLRLRFLYHYEVIYSRRNILRNLHHLFFYSSLLSTKLLQNRLRVKCMKWRKALTSRIFWISILIRRRGLAYRSKMRILPIYVLIWTGRFCRPDRQWYN